MTGFLSIWGRVAFAAVLSTLIAVTGGSARAHEVLPAIADMEQVDGRLVFTVRASIEGFVAGIDLTEVADTNDAAEAADYDALRQLEPAALEDRFRAFWPQMADDIAVTLGQGGSLPLTLDAVTVPEVGDTGVQRSSTFVFSAELPQGAETVTVGWDRAFGTLVIRQQGVEAPYDGFLEAGAVSDPITLAGGDQAGLWETFINYIPVGFDHIVPLGLDHILFVLGLFFLSTKFGPLLWQVSAFTLAHTITLALAALGYVSVPGSVVEPIIAASIVFVAVENIVSRGLTPWRPIVVFGFGLLHGLGFASVLGEFGLPENAFVPALIGFNIGVELGQLFVIAIAFLIVREAIRVDEGRDEVRLAKDIYLLLPGLAIGAGFVTMAIWPEPEVPPMYFAVPIAALSLLCWLSVKFRDQIDAYRSIVAVPASAAIALVGAYWFVERVFL